jgi:hypothetical protein
VKFAGLDVAAGGLDIVTVDLDTHVPQWHHLPGGAKGWDTARKMREVLPHPSYWDDIALLAIERPIGIRTNVIWAQGLVIGAVLARVPASVVIQDYQANEWKALVGLSGGASKEEVMAWASEFGSSSDWDEHACDALAICHASLNHNNAGVPL